MPRRGVTLRDGGRHEGQAPADDRLARRSRAVGEPGGDPRATGRPRRGGDAVHDQPRRRGARARPDARPGGRALRRTGSERTLAALEAPAPRAEGVRAVVRGRRRGAAPDPDASRRRERARGGDGSFGVARRGRDDRRRRHDPRGPPEGGDGTLGRTNAHRDHGGRAHSGRRRDGEGAVMERAVLACSGGLDPSVAIRWLAEQGYEVHAVAVDVGQQEEFDQVRRRGELAGAASVRIVDAVDRFASDFLTRAIKANGLYEQKYPMVSGLARPLIADEVVKVAREIDAGSLAHGCTGKGNDQVRFEVSFGVLAPDLRVIAPIRDDGIPREKAMALADEWGIPLSSVAAAYSVDENLWGRTVECGPLEDPWTPPPEDAFERTRPPSERPGEPAELSVGFEAGVPVALDGVPMALPELIGAVDALGGRYGFGRVDMIENRRVGIKSRELYEVPGALALIGAHRALEDLTLEREVAHYKPGLEQRWADLVYDGLWFSPLREAIDAFVDATQTHVSEIGRA